MARLINQLQPTTESNYVSLDGPIGTAGELGSIITIGSEQMLVRDGLGTTGLDVERAVNGTTIAAHQVGATVSLTRNAHPVYSTTRAFTIAEMQSLDTPITVVPAPGSNKVIVPHAYSYRAVIDSALLVYPYLAFGDYNDTGWYASLGTNSSDLTNATGTVSFGTSLIWSGAGAAYDVSNLPLVLQSDTAASGTATLTLTVYYTIADYTE